MKTIIIKALNPKGQKAINEHYKTTPRRYLFVMKLNGVRQELIDDTLLIHLDGKHIRDLELYFPEKLIKYLDEQILNLSKEISEKMKVTEGKDFRIGYT